MASISNPSKESQEEHGCWSRRKSSTLVSLEQHDHEDRVIILSGMSLKLTSCLGHASCHDCSLQEEVLGSLRKA